MKTDLLNQPLYDAVGKEDQKKEDRILIVGYEGISESLRKKLFEASPGITVVDESQLTCEERERIYQNEVGHLNSISAKQLNESINRHEIRHFCSKISGGKGKRSRANRQSRWH